MPSSKVNNFLRIVIPFTAAILPTIFLVRGIYGSFLFVFSIPLFWQVGLRGESITSLGLTRKHIQSSIIIGFITGCILGLFGGSILRLLGITGYAYSKSHSLQYSIGNFNIAFPLEKEIGYQLLIMSNSLAGMFIYLIFTIFVIGLGEEMFWRGFIQQKISGYFSIHISVWLTAVLFALIHFYIFVILPVKAGIYLLFLIAIAGGVWGYLFVYFKNIWAPAISHGIVAFIIWKYYFFHFLPP